MKVSVNGNERSLPDGASLDALRESLSQEDSFFAEAKGAAFAVNNSVVPKKDWASKELQDGDTILIIKATQGG